MSQFRGFQPDYTVADELPVDDLVDLEISLLNPALSASTSHLPDQRGPYLQEIGRVHDKGDEEVSEASKFSVTCGCWNHALVRQIGSNSALYLRLI